MNDDIHTPLASGIVLPDATTVRSVGIIRLLVVTLAAWALCRASPATIRAVLSRLAVGAEPATYPEAESALLAISQFSKTAAGPYGCLRRSLGACLLLRLDCKWPHWCVGVP
ncbi:MAG: lasso peptide biosynthesis B2 protein, partial [Mycobacterium sp.]|nr:lasso peptide biosynthesis B2 protein [Mycobacterium sp.]